MSKFTTPVGRAIFVSVWEPEKDQQGREKYKLTLCIPKSENLNDIKAAINEVISSKWPKGAPADLRFPVKDGDTDQYVQGANAGKLKKEFYPAMAGCWVVNFSTNAINTKTGKLMDPPRVVDRSVQDVLDQSKLYSGCYVKVSGYAYGYANNLRGIGFCPEFVQVVADGERIGFKQRNPEDVFAPIPDDEFAPVAPAQQVNPYGAPAPQQAPQQANPFGAPAPQQAPQQSNPFGAPAQQPPAAPAQGNPFLS